MALELTTEAQRHREESGNLFGTRMLGSLRISNNLAQIGAVVGAGSSSESVVRGDSKPAPVHPNTGTGAGLEQAIERQGITEPAPCLNHDLWDEGMMRLSLSWQSHNRENPGSDVFLARGGFYHPLSCNTPGETRPVAGVRMDRGGFRNLPGQSIGMRNPPLPMATP